MEGPARNPAPIQCHAWFKPTKPYISGKENAHANSNYSDRSCDHLETANSISTESVYQPASPCELQLHRSPVYKEFLSLAIHKNVNILIQGPQIPVTYVQLLCWRDMMSLLCHGKDRQTSAVFPCTPLQWCDQPCASSGLLHCRQPSLEAIPSRVASGRKVRTNCRSVQTSFSFPQPLACQSNGIPEQRLKPIGCRAQSDDECITGSPNPEATGRISSTGDDAPFSAGKKFPSPLISAQP